MRRTRSAQWVFLQQQALLNKKKKALISGDKEEQRKVPHELKYKTRKAKDS